MSIAFYTELGEEASSLIKEYGRQVVLRRRDYGEIQDRPCWVVRTQFDPQVVDGEAIMYSDHRYLMAADVDPAPDWERDSLFIDGVELRIVEAPPLKPAEVVLLYDVQARR